jgi:hypothetical protein
VSRLVVAVKCQCGIVNHLNPVKHRYRPKWCVACRAPLTEAESYGLNLKWLKEKARQVVARQLLKRPSESDKQIIDYFR